MTVHVGQRLADLDCTVAGSLVLGCDMLLGLDGIEALGGVTVRRGVAMFGHLVGAAAVVDQPQDTVAAGPRELKVEGSDFQATFQGGKWTVNWKWKGDPPVMQTSCGEYGVRLKDRAAYEEELQKWIDDGYLVPHNLEKHGELRGVIPLMAICQANKGKVRPVMDYRQLNSHVISEPCYDTDVCGDKLRAWRRMGTDLVLLDLRKAYLQLFVGDDLVRYQGVKYRGKTYIMTRMGFGLNCAPKIMTQVLREVLSLRQDVHAATDSYIDDVVVNESTVPSSTV